MTAPTTDTRPLLTLVGQALHGPLWQSALARSLGVSDRTLRFWVAGTRNPPPDLLTRLALELAHRHNELNAALIEVLCAIADQPQQK